MSEFNKISELIQKFGLISGKKQIFKTIQSFLNGFEKADLAVSVTQDAGGRCLMNINSRYRLSEDIFIKLAESLEPFISRYFFSGGGPGGTAVNIADFIDFEHHESPSDAPAGYMTAKKAELKGSLIVPVFLENKVYSIFAIFSRDEFELTRQELLAVNVLAHMTALSMKTLAVNQKMQKMINELKREKNEVVEKAARLSKVLDLSHSLVSLGSYEKLLDVTLNSYCGVFDIEQAVILGINHHKNELYVEDCAGFNADFAANFKLPCGYGLIGAVIEKNEPYFRKNLFETGEELAVIPFSGVSGLVCGAIVLYDRFNRLTYGDDEYELMWMLANFFSLALNIIKVQSVSDTFEKDMEARQAAAPQAPAPAAVTPVEGETDGARQAENGFADAIRRFLTPSAEIETAKIRIATEYMQAADCGGDLIDVFKTSDNYITVAVADVSGRGVQAGVTAAMLRAQLKTVCSYNGELRKIMFDLNNLVCEDIDVYNFITLFLLKISPNAGRAAFSNAGHCPVIHYIKEGASAVVHESRNSPLGVMRNTDFKEGILILNRDDILLLYTNGLAEAKNPAGEPFGRQRLCELIKSSAGAGCDEIKEIISAQIKSHTGKSGNFDDDIAFTVVKVG
jgi:serine phosphatase RsbU (regulator of sigma subunit)